MKTKRSLAIVIAMGITLPVSVFAQAVKTDAENRSQRYEDDAWYDVSEWFDGNDYNPTDEAIGRWDNESWQYSAAMTSDDVDDDYKSVTVNDYFGQDYDPNVATYSNENDDAFYDSYTRYFDTDNDNLYDGYAVYRDTDADGTYDDSRYYPLVRDAENRQLGEKMAQQQIKNTSSQMKQVSGEVVDANMLNRMGDLTRVLVVEDAQGNKTDVDLGPQALALQVFEDDKVVVTGPMTRVGDRPLLIATRIEINGKATSVERAGRSYAGTVQSVRTAKRGNSQRLVVKLKTQQDKMLTVDMGPADQASKPKVGDKLNVQGIPVKTGDRVVLMASPSNR